MEESRAFAAAHASPLDSASCEVREYRNVESDRRVDAICSKK